MAMASTVAHDSHHMIVVGTSEDDMALAANRLGEVGGGVVFFADGKEGSTRFQSSFVSNALPGWPRTEPKRKKYGRKITAI